MFGERARKTRAGIGRGCTRGRGEDCIEARRLHRRRVDQALGFWTAIVEEFGDDLPVSALAKVPRLKALVVGEERSLSATGRPRLRG